MKHQKKIRKRTFSSHRFKSSFNALILSPSANDPLSVVPTPCHQWADPCLLQYATIDLSSFSICFFVFFPNTDLYSSKVMLNFYHFPLSVRSQIISFLHFMHGPFGVFNSPVGELNLLRTNPSHITNKKPHSHLYSTLGYGNAEQVLLYVVLYSIFYSPFKFQCLDFISQIDSVFATPLFNHGVNVGNIPIICACKFVDQHIQCSDIASYFVQLHFLAFFVSW